MQAVWTGAPPQGRGAAQLHTYHRARPWRAMTVASICAVGISAGMAYHVSPAWGGERQVQLQQLTSLRDFTSAAAQLPAALIARLGSKLGPERPRTRSVTAKGSGAAGSWLLAPSKGDGRCLFRSLAQGDHRLRNHGKPLAADRETDAADQVCNRLLERRDDIAPFIDEDFNAYVAAMRRPHTWGGEPELSVAADVLARPVHVYDSSLQPITQYDPIEQTDNGDPQEPVSLLFQRLGHYDLLVPHEQPQSKL
mmetsp:Transcript_807/g.2492  ORF Transcript_807/g.2492 Transcript_807/m.2492 type:complete len:252 (-) Transcript_807:2033-2788(-)